MKVLFVQVHSGIGGATTSMFQLIRELKKKGFKPEVLITGGDGPLVSWLKENGVPVRMESNLLSYGHGNGARTEFWSFPPFRPLTELFKLRKSIKRYQQIFQEIRPDLVYLNSSILWPAAIAAKNTGIRVVTHVREVWYHGIFGIRKRYFIRLTEKLSDHIFVLSHFSKSQFSKNAHDKITVAYNAVDFRRYDEVSEDMSALKVKLGLDPYKVMIVMLGGALAHKGGSIFLKAAKRIVQKSKRTEFAVLGHVTPYFPWNDNSLKGRLRRFLYVDPGNVFQKEVDQHKLRDFVHFPGAVSNVAEWIKASDILVFPATTDHFGRPLIEAGYSKVPVIASDTDTSKELVPNGQNGLLFKNKSATSLVNAISALISEPATRHRMGKEGEALAKERYSLDKQLDLISTVLKKL